MYAIPTEIKILILLNCGKDYKAISNMFLYFKDLRDYVNKYVHIKKQLKNQIIVHTRIKEQSFYSLPNGKKHGEYKRQHEILICPPFHRFYKQKFKEYNKSPFHYLSKSNIRVFTSYKDGKLNGEYKSWYTNGNLKIHTFYKKGKKCGQFKQWKVNGKPDVDSLYVNGKKHGRHIVWFNGFANYRFYDNGKRY